MCSLMLASTSCSKRPNFISASLYINRYMKGCQDRPPSIKHDLWGAINFGLHTKYILATLKLLNKQLSCQWSEMLQCSYGITILTYRHGDFPNEVFVQVLIEDPVEELVELVEWHTHDLHTDPTVALLEQGAVELNDVRTVIGPHHDI